MWTTLRRMAAPIILFLVGEALSRLLLDRGGMPLADRTLAGLLAHGGFRARGGRVGRRGPARESELGIVMAQDAVEARAEGSLADNARDADAPPVAVARPPEHEPADLAARVERGQIGRAHV